MKKISPRKIPKQELPLWNGIFRLNGDLSVKLGGEALRVLFDPPGSECRPDQFVSIVCDDQNFWIGLKARDGFLEREMARTFDGLRVNGLPGELKAAVFEVLLEGLFESFESRTGLAVRIKEVLPEYPVEDHSKTLPFCLSTDRGYPEVQGCFYFDDKSFKRFSQLISGVPADVSSHCLDIPVKCSLEVGKTRVRAGELESIGVLDLIRMDEHYPSEGKGLLLHLYPDVEIRTLVEGNKAVVKERKESEVSDAGVAQGFESVEVELRFEVGEKRIALKDLSNLKPGYTFDLEVPPDRAVTIRANGKKIGRGELVDIDGRMGVQVLEVFGNADDRHV